MPIPVGESAFSIRASSLICNFNPSISPPMLPVMSKQITRSQVRNFQFCGLLLGCFSVPLRLIAILLGLFEILFRLLQLLFDFRHKLWRVARIRERTAGPLPTRA